jgi:hypothetical protein
MMFTAAANAAAEIAVERLAEYVCHTLFANIFSPF